MNVQRLDIFFGECYDNSTGIEGSILLTGSIHFLAKEIEVFKAIEEAFHSQIDFSYAMSEEIWIRDSSKRERNSTERAVQSIDPSRE
jgi:hypothetical protein